VAIHKYVRSTVFDDDVVKVMIEAYEATLRALDVPKGDGNTNQRIADLVMHMTQGGERDPQVICKRVVMQLSGG